ncbi:DNA adenine methylase [Candidatus Cyanaurora vandensis]|uniref:DNA adenine methylase n=1 Tax=Candidatus Cyanaurora vandensis TaxID=2714958 RepID=UPI0025801295|nr:DNA adenine methylase [Candidatus Cyanaurora vandensis]
MQLIPPRSRPVKPFLKWAGGKGQLLKTIDTYLPLELKKGNIKSYVEPFLGGGAVFFYVAQHYPCEEFYLFDVNNELIKAYIVVQQHVDELIEELKKIEYEYLALSPDARESYYYAVRYRYNESHLNNISTHNISTSYSTCVEQVSRLIFMNKTCFNGLFRVNSKGGFNVPFGDYANPTICDVENLTNASRLLRGVIIKCCDFSKSVEFASSTSFFYLDPPYRPVSKTASFKAYAKIDFNDEEQIRLGIFCEKISHLGVKLMLSNSDPTNADELDNFFGKLYSEFNLCRVNATRMINSKGSKRGVIREILVTNYLLEKRD